MGRYSAIDYTSGGNDAASGLARGVALASGVMDAYQKGKKIRTEREREELLKEAATQQAAEEVNPTAVRMASEYGAAAQNPDVEAAPGARELYVQAAEDQLQGGKQFRLGDVASPNPLTTEQIADARIGLQQQALAKVGDVEGASRLRADRVSANSAAQQAKLSGIQLKQAELKQGDDAVLRGVKAETADFMKSRLKVANPDGTETFRPSTDDDHIAALRFTADSFTSKGMLSEASDMRKTMREGQEAILKSREVERKRDGGLAVAALKADPTNTKPLTDFYNKHFPDGYSGEVLRDFKTGKYQTVREDGVKGELRDLPQVLGAVDALADTKYAMDWLDQEAKRAKIKSDEASANKDSAIAASSGIEITDVGGNRVAYNKRTNKQTVLGATPASKTGDGSGSGKDPRKNKLDFINDFRVIIAGPQKAGETSLTQYSAKDKARMEETQKLALDLASRSYDAGLNPDPSGTMRQAERLYETGKHKLPMPSSEAEFSKLAPGSEFIAPDGSIRVKPKKQ